MRLPPLRPVALLIGCLFASALPVPGRGEGLRLAVETGQEPAAQITGPATDVPVSGAEADGAESADSPPIRLRAERKFNVLGQGREPLVPGVGIEHPVSLHKGDDYPVFITADQIEGEASEVTEAAGQVELRRLDALLVADHLTYRPLDDEVEAEGNVRLWQENTVVDTPHLKMRLDDTIGFADEADYHMVREVRSQFYQKQKVRKTNASSNSVDTGSPMMMNVADSYGLATVGPESRLSQISGHAERIDFEGRNRYHLSQATYSTCKPGAQDWYLRGSEVDLDIDDNHGEATHASLWFLGVPLLYTPWAAFPVSRERKSGFLYPSFAMSSRNGFDFQAPYYWNIAPEYDLTLFPRYMARRGAQLGGEGRYHTDHAKGTLKAELLPDDLLADRQRWAYQFKHRQTLGQGFSAQVNWNRVSDDHYFEDMSSDLMQTSQRQLTQQAALGYQPASWLQTQIQVLKYQTLNPDSDNLIARPYFLEPQLNAVAARANVFKTDLTALAQFSRFTHPDKVNADRVVFYPQVSLPIVHPAFQVIPKVGVHATKYAFSQQTAGEPESLQRTLPVFSVDSTVVFERDTRWMDLDYIQTVEPRLYYVNIPYKKQDDIPLFDTGLSDFNFAQIFSENRYSGYDRLNDANQLTAALVTRMIDAGSGVERFKAMIGQRYYFSPQRVTIDGETQRQNNFSNLIVAVNGLVLPKTYADAAWEFNYKEGWNERFSVGARFQPELGKVLSASYRYTRDPLSSTPTVDQIDASGMWPLSPSWYAVGRYNYSLRDHKPLEIIAGLEYNAGCWSWRLVGQRQNASSSEEPNDTVFFQLELGDLASLGSNPLTLLRRSVPGYGKTNELPAAGGFSGDSLSNE